MAKIPVGPSPAQAAARKWLEASARRVVSGRPQPSANLDDLLEASQSASKGKGLSVEERRAIMRDDAEKHLSELHRHAQIAAGGNGPYPITGYVHGEGGVASPANATISETTLNDFLANWYGKNWPEVRDRMIKAQGAPEWHFLRPSYDNTGSQAKNLDHRIYEIDVDDPNAINAATPDAGLYQSNPLQPEVGQARFNPQYIRHHEFSHLLFPPKDEPRMSVTLFPDYGSGAQGSIFTPSANNYPHLDFAKFSRALGGNPGDLAAANMHIRYTSRPDEMLATLPHLMRLEYGLTGKPLRTEADRIRAVQKWIAEPTRYNQGAKGWHEAFGPDPIMQHGPEAGNPAHGYEFLRNSQKLIIPRLPKVDKKAVIDAMEGFGSTDPKGESQYG